MPSRYYLRTRRSVVNYSHIIVRVARLMKRPSVIDLPSGRVPERRCRWPPVGTETCGGGKSISWTPCWFPNFREFIEVELGQTEQRWAHEAPGHATPLRRTLVARGHLLCLLALSRSFLCLSWPIKNLQKVSWHLDFVWY